MAERSIRKRILILLGPKGAEPEWVQALRREEFEPLEAPTPADFFHRLHREHVDLILIDGTQEDLDLIRLLKEVRQKMLRTQYLPVLVALDGHAEVATKRLRSAGASDFVLLPIAPQVLRARVAAHLQTKQLHDDLAEAEANLTSARRELVESIVELLPKEWPRPEPYTIDVLHRPSGRRGGDFFDIFALPKDRVAIVLADAEGAGLRAVSRVAAAQALARARLPQADHPAEVLADINRTMIDIWGDECLLMMYVGILEPATHCLAHAAAGHAGPLVLAPGESLVDWIDMASGPPLGVEAAARYTASEIEMPPGMRLLLATNGAWQMRNPAGEPLGFERFCDIVNATRGVPVSGMLEVIQVRLDKYAAGAEQSDDLLVALVGRKK